MRGRGCLPTWRGEGAGVGGKRRKRKEKKERKIEK